MKECGMCHEPIPFGMELCVECQEFFDYVSCGIWC